MNVDFTPEQKPYVLQAIQSGRIRRPEDAAKEAFSLWVEREQHKNDNPTFDRSEAAEAAARLLKRRERYVLPEGVTIRSLIDAGRD